MICDKVAIQLLQKYSRQIHTVGLSVGFLVPRKWRFEGLGVGFVGDDVGRSIGSGDASPGLKTVGLLVGCGVSYDGNVQIGLGVGCRVIVWGYHNI